MTSQRSQGGVAARRRGAPDDGVVCRAPASSRFAIFDVFPSEAGREAHLAGPVAAALIENAPELLASDPSIETIDVLATSCRAKRRTSHEHSHLLRFPARSDERPDGHRSSQRGSERLRRRGRPARRPRLRRPRPANWRPGAGLRTSRPARRGGLPLRAAAWRAGGADLRPWRRCPVLQPPAPQLPGPPRSDRRARRSTRGGPPQTPTNRCPWQRRTTWHSLCSPMSGPT